MGTDLPEFPITKSDTKRYWLIGSVTSFYVTG